MYQTQVPISYSYTRVIHVVFGGVIVIVSIRRALNMQEGVQKLSFYGVYVFNRELNTGCDYTREIHRPEIIMWLQC